MWLTSFPNTTYWRDCLFPIVYSCSLHHILIDHISVTLFLGSFFCSVDLYVCICASIVLFNHYSFVVDLEIWNYDICSFVFLSQDCLKIWIFNCPRNSWIESNCKKPEQCKRRASKGWQLSHSLILQYCVFLD